MKGRRYAISGTRAVASPTKTMLGLTSTAAIEPGVYALSIGSQDTPGDVSLEWYIQRYTAAGTATSVTPQNLGPSTTAATATAGSNHTVEPTYTANAILWRMALNQRASHSLILDPDGAWYAPATANNGLGCYPVHASSTVNVGGYMQYQE